MSIPSPKDLARVSARHPWKVVGAWAVVLVASFVLIGMFMADAVTNEANVTNRPESVRGMELLEDRLRGEQPINEAVVVRSTGATVDDAAFRSYVESLHGKISALGPDIVKFSTSYYQTNDQNLVSQDRRATILPLIMAGDVDQATENIPLLLDIVEEQNGTGQFEVYISGFASISHDFNMAAEKDLQRSEFGPLPAALIILIIVFGALAAAVLPIVLAALAIIAAIAGTAVIGQQYQFSFFVTNMIVMMGLAVGIDYSLFIISRFREERSRGLEKLNAIEVAGSTAGRAVLFSGITVVVALMGLLIVPQTIFRSLSGGAILVVLGSVAASLTLLPALLSLLGDKINALRLPFVQRARAELEEEDQPGGFWDRVARTVMARPIISVTLAAGLLVVLAIPAFSMKLGFSGVNTLPESFQSKQGFKILERDFAGGQLYPAEVVIDGQANSPAVQSAIERLKATVANDPLFGPAHFETNASGDLGLLAFQLAADPNSTAATDAVERLREQYVPPAFSGVDVDVSVTGLAALNHDSFEMLAYYQPIVFAFVLGLSFLLLTMVFRSIVVPAKAIIMNLLSVGAAYGLIVLASQEGWGKSITGFQQVEAIEAWLPLFLFSILFGLSMDYHVFLLSRIKEHYDLTGDNTGAVAFGLRSTGRLITGAALIMVAVFGGFAIGDMVMFQQMGFGLGVAVLIDATVIRSVLVPASMKLLGRWNWYLPPVLSWLPHVGIEAPEAPRGREVAGTRGA
jgi:RND superfamily putative drug exporter